MFELIVTCLSCRKDWHAECVGDQIPTYDLEICFPAMSVETKGLKSDSFVL